MAAHLLPLIHDLFNKITSLIKRCALTKPAKDNADYQIVQCQYLGKIADIEAASLYGYSYNATINSTGIMFSILGNEENRAAFFNLPQERFKNLKAGEVQIGSPVTKSSVKFALDNSIIINSLGEISIISASDLLINTTGNINIKASGTLNIEADGNLEIKAPQITLAGNVIITENLTVSGNAVISGTLSGDGKDMGTHVHSGVTIGTENTGPPV